MAPRHVSQRPSDGRLPRPMRLPTPRPTRATGAAVVALALVAAGVGAVPLPPMCDASQNSAITAAVDAFKESNDACDDTLVRCRDDTNDRRTCTGDCTHNYAAFKSACASAKGHYCSIHLTTTANAGTNVVDYRTSMCLPEDCTDNNLSRITEWFEGVYCGNAEAGTCTATFSCSYSITAATIGIIVAVLLVGLCVTAVSSYQGWKWWKARRQQQLAIEAAGLMEM